MRISAMKNTQTELVTNRNGFRLALSVDGALTGRGGDIIIIDDPIAALAATLSQKSREHVVDWYFNTLLSRLDDKQNGAIVLVMQRLHEDDLAGVLLRGSDEWTVLSLPAIAEQDEQIPIGDGQFHCRRAGDVLPPEREPREVLESLRAQLGAELAVTCWRRRWSGGSRRSANVEACCCPACCAIIVAGTSPSFCAFVRNASAQAFQALA
jgi:hypothetical protein